MISPPAAVAAIAAPKDRQGEAVVHGLESRPVTDTAERLFNANAAGARKRAAMTAIRLKMNAPYCNACDESALMDTSRELKTSRLLLNEYAVPPLKTPTML